MVRRNRLRLYFAFLDRKQAALSSLPHLLYSLRLLLTWLAARAGGPAAWELAVNGLFALAILAGLYYGMRPDYRRPPRWIGAWAGYAFLLILELGLRVFPGSPVGTFGGILWLAGYSAALIYLGRGDRLRTILAVLPVAPVFIWSTALHPALAAGGPGPALAAMLFGGLVMAAASALFEGFMWGSQGFWAALIAILTGGLPVAYASQSPAAGPVGPAQLAVSLLGYLAAAAIFGWPAWVGWFWDWVKSKVTTGV